MPNAVGQIQNTPQFPVLAAAFAALSLSAVPAKAYPIDCAILLCLAGGFPLSSECMPAKAEMIRRITPFPVEPPLQLWNCPMGGGAAPAGLLDRDGLPPEVRAYRDGIEIYHIDYRQTQGSGDLQVRDRSRVGEYDIAGHFFWSPIRMRDAPTWIFAATGGNEQAVKGMAGSIFRWRGVLLRWRDHAGNISTEWVRY